MNICAYVHILIYIHVRTYTCRYMHINTYAWPYTLIHTYTYIYIQIHAYTGIRSDTCTYQNHQMEPIMEVLSRVAAVAPCQWLLVRLTPARSAVIGHKTGVTSADRAKGLDCRNRGACQGLWTRSGGVSNRVCKNVANGGKRLML